jgi:hypothetical protein
MIASCSSYLFPGTPAQVLECLSQAARGLTAVARDCAAAIVIMSAVTQVIFCRKQQISID